MQCICAYTLAVALLCAVPVPVSCSTGSSVGPTIGRRLLQQDATITGRVIAFGDNSWMQSTAPLITNGNVTAVAAGVYHSLALLTSGRVVAWGRFMKGLTPVPANMQPGIIGTAGTAIAIAAGQYHSLILLKNGTVIGWASSLFSQTFAMAFTIPPAAQTNAAAICAGSGHSLVLLSNSTVVAFGYNAFGQANVPPVAAQNVEALSCGRFHSLALLTDATVVCWGDNSHQQCQVPQAVQGNVVKISAGQTYSMALLQSGVVVVWGNGLGSQQLSLPWPTEQTLSISAGYSQHMAIDVTGLLATWATGQPQQARLLGLPGVEKVRVLSISAGAYHSLTIVESASSSKGVQMPVLASPDRTLLGQDHVIANQAPPPSSPRPKPSRGTIVGLAIGMTCYGLVCWLYWHVVLEHALGVNCFLAFGLAFVATLLMPFSALFGCHMDGWSCYRSEMLRGLKPTCVIIGKVLWNLLYLPGILAVNLSKATFKYVGIGMKAAYDAPIMPFLSRVWKALASCATTFGVGCQNTIRAVFVTFPAFVLSSMVSCCSRPRNPRPTAQVVPVPPPQGGPQAYQWATSPPTRTLVQLNQAANTAATPSASNPFAATFPAATQHLGITTMLRERILERLLIPWNDIEVHNLIARGGFGVVHQGVWEGEPVAIKIYQLSITELSSADQEALFHEAYILCQLRHPRIALVYGLASEADRQGLVMKHYPRGSLAQAMQEGRRLSVAEGLALALQVAKGMNWLHDGQAMPVVHGDLKASNLLLEDDGQVVIADFGLARVLRHGGDDAAAASGALSIPISPPEVLNNPLAPRAKATDVYAFAILLLELMQNKPAYPPGSNTEFIISMVSAGHRPEITTGVPANVAEIIRSCWNQDPVTRPSFASIVEALTACLPSAPMANNLPAIQPRSRYPSIPGVGQVDNAIA